MLPSARCSSASLPSSLGCPDTLRKRQNPSPKKGFQESRGSSALGCQMDDTGGRLHLGIRRTLNTPHSNRTTSRATLAVAKFVDECGGSAAAHPMRER